MSRNPKRGWCVLVGCGLLALARPAYAAPSDPLAAGLPDQLPDRDAKRPDGAKVGGGSGSISEQGGAASYGVQINVPAGRNGMQPALALSYSSDAPLRGGVAAGWNLGVGFIERDPGFPGERRFRSPAGRLVAVGGADASGSVAYRAEVDTTFTHYIHRVGLGGDYWLAMSPDGVVREYRELDAERWRLTTETDPFGNTVGYRYTSPGCTPGLQCFEEHLLQHIDYTSNPAAGLGSHARVELVYAPLDDSALGRCGGTPAGAATDFHFGLRRWSGSRTLTQIKVWVRDRPAPAVERLAHTYTLNYDSAEIACPGPGLRYLTRIDESAFTEAHAETRAPPIALTYGPRHHDFGRTIVVTNAPREEGDMFGPRTGFLDLDGDGRLDFVEVLTEDRCRLSWRKGLADGQFGPTQPSKIDLPSVPWKSGGRAGAFEYCRLNGQNVPATNNCLRPELTAVTYNFSDFDHDGRVDLLTALHIPRGTGSGTLSRMIGDGRYGGCDKLGGDIDLTVAFDCGVSEHLDPGNPTPPPIPPCTDPPVPERNGYQYVWRVQRNLGSSFAPLATNGSDSWTLLSNTPLPSSAGATNAATAWPDVPGLVDINGDGYPDAVSLDPLPAHVQTDVDGPANDLDCPPGPDAHPCTHVLTARPGDVTSIRVWPGNGRGFGAMQTWPFRMVNRTHPWVGSAGGSIASLLDGSRTLTNTTMLAFRDLNGDGLPDFLITDGPSMAVSYNMAGAFTSGTLPGGAFSEVVALGSPGPIEQTSGPLTEWQESDKILLSGARAYTRRLFDLDDDGRLAIVSLPQGRAAQLRQAQILAPGGNALGAATSLPDVWKPLEGFVTATHGEWARQNDFLDLTGDGIPDAVTWNADGSATVRTDAGTDPPRLLIRVDNGRGATTRFKYDTTTALGLSSATGGLSARWLAVQVTVSPGGNQPDLVTSYRFEQPAFGRDSALDPAAPHFRGFARVTAESSGQQGPASKQTVTDYDFATHLHNDYGPRPVLVRTSIRQAGSWVPASRKEIAYASAPLLAGQVSFTYQSEETTRTCTAGLDCAAEATLRHTVSDTWSPYVPGSGGGPALMLHTDTRESIPGASLRHTKHQYQVRYMAAPFAATDYRVLPIQEDHGYSTTIASVSGTQTRFSPWARTVTVYDGAGLPQETRTYTDVSNYVTTRRRFDPRTGNVVAVISPNHAGMPVGSETAETYLYDDHQLRVKTTTRRDGKYFIETRDVATGALLSRDGPSFHLVAPATCLFRVLCIPMPALFKEGWTIDGFGRVLDHSVSRDGGKNGSYLYRLADSTTYVESAIPNRRVVSRVQEGNVRVEDETAYDGLGRVLTATGRGASASCDAVVSYRYDAAGELAGIDAPNPAADCQPVTSTFARDGLGRVTSLARPDGSFESVVYTGLTAAVVEQASQLIGRRTTLVHDAFGQLAQVEEQTGAAPATTVYAYDLLGRIASITDADGHVTTLGYDWRGLRTSVTRGARTWLYAYDPDGNLITETEPVPAGQAADRYQTRTTYDQEDRALVHTPAPRDLAPARLAALGIGAITHAYDRPEAVDAPGTITLPFGTIQLLYTATGQVARQERTLRFDQGANVTTTQWVLRQYDDLGHARKVTWDDGTEWTYAYDRRGAVSDVLLGDLPNASPIQLAHYERRVAGMPNTRTSAAGQRRVWTYDVLGRVKSDQLSRLDTGATIHSRVYDYNGIGRLRGVTGSTSGLDAKASYEYDALHRIRHAVGPLAYRGDFDYTGAGNVKTAAVSGASDAPDRNVVYAYGDVDPQAVDRLTDALGAVVASFQYDRAGNVVQRTVNRDQLTFTWDGDGMLREAAGRAGAERYYFDAVASRIAAIGPEGVKVWFGESETLFAAAGNQLRRYHHVGAGEPIARIERTAATSTARQVELLYADALQNLALSTRLDGSTTSAFVYGAFGEVVAQRDDTGHRRRFNGKEHDVVSGLRHYGYRSYDPVSLRWTSGDPMYRFSPDLAWSEPQRANLYGFSGNNPVRYYDPDGRNWLGDAYRATKSFVKKEVVPRAEGGLKVAGGLVVMGIGVAVAETGVGAGVGAGIFVAGADYGGSGLKQMVVGTPQQTLVGAALGPKAQAAEEAIVEGAAGAAPFLAPATGLMLERAAVRSAAEESAAAEAAGPKCFVAGTLVLTDNGPLPIEAIQVGDRVWSRDPDSGAEDYRSVERTFVTPEQRVVSVELSGAQTLEVTAGHRFWVADAGWRAAEDLRPGDRLLDAAGRAVPVRSITDGRRRTTVYNLEVDGYHTYYAGSAEVLVHNGCGGSGEGGVQHASSFDKARTAAFENAGMTDPAEVTFTKVDPNTGTVVEFKGKGGAKVAYDSPHASPGPGHDKPHVGWQTGGKRGAGGTQRGNITYGGPQHPHRSPVKGQGSI